jgi:hypothetical protein
MSNGSSTPQGQGAAQADPQGSPGQRQPKPKTSTAVVAGIGGTVTALVVVAAIMATRTAPIPVDPVPAPITQSSVATIQSPAAVAPSSAVAPDRSNQCEMPSLALNFVGTGIIRVHSGSYVSPPVQLNSDLQRITFPIPGPSQAGQGTITVETTPGLLHFRTIDNEPSGTVVLDKKENYFHVYRESHQLPIAVGWSPRNPC